VFSPSGQDPHFVSMKIHLASFPECCYPGQGNGPTPAALPSTFCPVSHSICLFHAGFRVKSPHKVGQSTQQAEMVPSAFPIAASGGKNKYWENNVFKPG